MSLEIANPAVQDSKAIPRNGPSVGHGPARLIAVQFRVIRALVIRDMQSQQANLAYGFAWVFFDAFLAFAGLLIVRIAIRGFTRPGIPPITYIVSGLVPWLMFNACYRLPGSAISRGKNLLALPAVTELDLVLASGIRIFLTFAILFVGLAALSSFYEHVGFPRFPLGVFLLFVCMWVMGIAFGFILMALDRVYRPAGKFVAFFLRFSTLLSGVIFDVTMFPTFTWPYLSWNPLLHIEELLRNYWFYSYAVPIGSPLYVTQWLVGMTFFGLLLERYARRRLPA